VFHVLPAVQKYEEKELLDHCWKVIENDTEEAVKAVKAVEAVKRQGIVVEGSVKRKILGERIVKGIRFPVMEQKEFVEFVLDSDILSQKETYGLMKYFNSVIKTPLGFSEAKRVGHLKIISRFRSLNGRLNNISGGNYYLGFSADKNIKLHAVRLFASENCEHSVYLTLYDFSGGVVANKTGEFVSKLIQSEKEKYHGFEIFFNPPIALHGNRGYGFWANIIDSSWCGQCGQYSVEHSGVKFQFFVYGKSNEVEKGQFSEFVFTVD